jgi:primosomal protein N' (replication factor Y)
MVAKENKYLIVDIIPLIRMPINAPDFFSYFSKQKLNGGEIVEVELKKRKIFGYVYKTYSPEKGRIKLKEEKIQLKPVLRIINNQPLIFDYQIQLAFWLKNYANLSLATALSLFFPYKKLFLIKKEKTESIKKGNFKIFLADELEKIEFENKKTLIIVPQESYLDYLKKIFPKANLILPNSEKKFFEILNKVINQEKEIFIGTKNTIFLPWQNLDQLIVYEEGSIFYKEFFKPPFFDYRKIFLKFAELNKINYIAFGKLPSFYLIKDQKFSLPLNFQRINPEEFENKISEFKKTVIFVPEKTFAKKIVCENCYQALTCPHCGRFLRIEENFIYCPYCLKKESKPEICPHCHQPASFLIFSYGAKAIYKILTSLNRQVYFLEKENKKIISEFNQKKEADLIGSLLLLNPNLENFEAFFFINFDEFYFGSDFYLQEKFIRVLEFFQKKTNQLFLVSKIINPQIEALIKNGEIINLLLEERKINDLPPYKRLVVLKEGSKNLNKLQIKLNQIKESLIKQNPGLKIYGPLFAHPFKKKQRYFLELIIKIPTDINFNLKKTLYNTDVEIIEADY